MVMKPWVVLPEELAKKYLDAHKNHILQETMQSAPPYEPQIFVASKAPQPIEDSKPLITLLKDAVIEKFGLKPINAESYV